MVSFLNICFFFINGFYFLYNFILCSKFIWHLCRFSHNYKRIKLIMALSNRILTEKQKIRRWIEVKCFYAVSGWIWKGNLIFNTCLTVVVLFYLLESARLLVCCRVNIPHRGRLGKLFLYTKKILLRNKYIFFEKYKRVDISNILFDFTVVWLEPAISCPLFKNNNITTTKTDRWSILSMEIKEKKIFV